MISGLRRARPRHAAARWYGRCCFMLHRQRLTITDGSVHRRLRAAITSESFYMRMRPIQFSSRLHPKTEEFYRCAVRALEKGGVPFLVGGAYALWHYTGIVRHTKDFDVFVRKDDAESALSTLSAAGYKTEL